MENLWEESIDWRGRAERYEDAMRHALSLAGYDLTEPVVMSPSDTAALRGLALDHIAKALRSRDRP